MSSLNQTPFSGLGPFGNFFHDQGSSYFSGAMAPGADVFAKSFSRWQLEMQGLMNRRAQAYLEMSSRVAHCRTPQDLMQEQQRFWQNAFQQYSDSSRQVMAIWSQMLPSAISYNAPQPGGRDYLSFPETRGYGNGSATPAINRPSDRKVA